MNQNCEMVVLDHDTQDCERAEGQRDKSNWCGSCQNLRAEKAKRERDALGHMGSDG